MKAITNIFTKISMRRSGIVIGLLCYFMTGSAQTDTLKNEFQKEFDAFKQQTLEEFETFKNHNDSVFYGFLKESWQKFDLLIDERKQKPKPVSQPKMSPVPMRQGQIEPVEGRSMLDEIQQNLEYRVEPIKYETYSPSKPFTNIDFYGSKVEVYKANVDNLSAGNVSNDAIADFYKNSVNNDELVYSVFHLRDKAGYNKLNGWGYLRLLQEASATYFNNLNERVLYTWTALLKSGYDVRVGFNKNDIYLLVNFESPVFYKQYLTKDNQKYYLIPFKGQNKKAETIQSFVQDYPGDLTGISLLIEVNPVLGKKTKSRKMNYGDQKINVDYNQHLVDFYQTYPDTELSVYFPPPLSSISLNSLGDILASRITSVDPQMKVNVLLDFVQHAFPYDTDNKQFGYENYFFAEESIYYPYADCEDRTVLLSQLVSHFAGLKSIGLVYPGHVTLAVNVPGATTGSYVLHNGEKYYVCDPTYIGAKCGMLMPEFEKQNPEIIEFEL